MPSPPDRPRVGYVLKVYPRFSETFVVNEILAHERAGADLRIFSLRPPVGGRFHPAIGSVRAPVTYVPDASPKGADLWSGLRVAGPGAAALLLDPDAAGPREVVQALALARHVREQGIDHLHAHFATVAAGVTRLAAQLTGISYSLTAHAKDIFHEEVDPLALRMRMADAVGVITVSDFNARFLRELAPEAPIHRVYNGLELDAFPYRPPQGRPPGIVAVGRLVEKKGFADLVDACAVLAAHGRDAGCQIVGEGPLESELRARIAAHGLSEQVRLLGPRTQDEVRTLVQGANVMATPCVVGADGNRDGLPTVLLEAMALGTPCVSTPVTGIPELVIDGRTGLVVGQHSPDELAGALARVLDDEGLRVSLARAGRALIEERFDIDRNAAAQRELLWPTRAEAPGRAAAELARAS
ncbi:MAG TPA: glycosyltransferase family 4 protein [Solirubrobacteraceae bacterium]|nr:glycosyltransferase family 4 protein [Solirubrobacteraceae bacterium]